MQTFEDRFGITPDVKSWLYANAWLQESPHRRDRRGRLVPLPPPAQRYIYRRPAIGEPGLFIPLSLAIGFTSGHYTDGQFAVSPLSFNLNTTGDSIAWAFYINFNSTSDSITGVTCGGAAMTKLASNYHGTLGAGQDMSAWYKLAPSQGASTAIVATQTGSGNWLMQGIAYSGTDTAALGTTVLGNDTIPSSNHATEPITTANANSWVVVMTQEAAQSGTLFSGTNTTLRGSISGFAGCGIFDSGLLATAGAKNLDLGVTTSGHEISFLAEMKVAGGAATFGHECFQPLSQPTNHFRPTVVM